MSDIEKAAEQLLEAIGSKDDKQAMVAVIGLIVAAVTPIERIASALEAQNDEPSPLTTGLPLP